MSPILVLTSPGCKGVINHYHCLRGSLSLKKTVEPNCESNRLKYNMTSSFLWCINEQQWGRQHFSMLFWFLSRPAAVLTVEAAKITNASIYYLVFRQILCFNSYWPLNLILQTTPFVRQNTPHPKELKAKAHKLFGKTKSNESRDNTSEETVSNVKLITKWHLILYSCYMLSLVLKLWILVLFVLRCFT